MNIEQHINFFNNLKHILTVLIEHEENLDIEKLCIEFIYCDDDELYIEYYASGKRGKDSLKLILEGNYHIKTKYFDMSNDEIIQNFFGVEK